MFKHHHLLSDSLNIEIDSPYRDLILVKGNEFDCENVVIEGDVVLSLQQDMHIKRIKLNLIGEYNLEYFEKLADGLSQDPVYERYCLLKVDWNNLLQDEMGHLSFGDYGDLVVPMNKLDDNIKKSHSRSGSTVGFEASKQNLLSLLINQEQGAGSSSSNKNDQAPSRPVYARTRSLPLLSKSHGHQASTSDSSVKANKPASGTNTILPKGSYKFHFKCVLPGNIPESIEGLHCGHILYKLQGNVERGRFEKAIKKAKCLRILRTLHPQNLNLSDIIDLDTTWPNKVQYNISLKRKAIAFGSNISVNLLIVPLVKGLKLKRMEGSIVQHSVVRYPGGRPTVFEKIIGKQKMPIPSSDELGEDQWIIKSSYKVPSRLNELTPTTDVKQSLLSVKHRFRISVQLKNKEGHVSEFRANLPVCVYVSFHHGEIIGKHFEITPHGYFVSDAEREDIIYKHEHVSVGLPRIQVAGPHSRDEYDEVSDTEESSEFDNSAPPLYQQHIYDPLYDLSSPKSPMEQLQEHSGVSPLSQASKSLSNLDGYFSIPTKQESNGPGSFSTSDLTLYVQGTIPSYSEVLGEEGDPPVPSYESTNSLTISPSQSVGFNSRSSSAISLARPPANKTSISPSSHKTIFSYFHHKAGHRSGSVSAKSLSPRESPLHSPSHSSLNIQLDFLRVPLNQKFLGKKKS